ncbi:MAG TPA: S9 family peptidase [bacterium]|nr:S9 family peptidase [bacterium]
MTSSKNSSHIRLVAGGLFLLLFLLSCSRAAPVSVDADNAAKPGDRVRDYLEIVDSGAGRLLPDGRKLFLSRGPGEVKQLYIENGAEQRQLTNGVDSVDSYEVNPGGTRLLFLSAPGGNEQYGIHLLTLADGKIEPLLADPAVKFGNVVWLDDDRFLYAANEVSPRDFYLYLYDIAARKKRLLSDKKGTHSIDDAKSADQFLFHTILSSTSTIPYLYENGTARKLKGAQDERYYQPVGFLNDGRIALITDEGSDTPYLELRDKQGRRETLHAGPWPVEQALIDPRDRTRIVFCTNEDGWSVCRRWQNGAVTTLPTGAGVVTLGDLSGDTIVYTLSRPDAIPRPALLRLTDNRTEEFGLTDPRGIDVAAFAAPELRRAISFDGLNIPYFLFTPKNGKPPYRTIVFYHGGPEGQFLPGFNAIFQYYLRKGFAVAAPNVRGSTGYGRRFTELDNYKLRMDSVKDAGAVLDDLVKAGLSRPDRFIAMGGSYGGFMTVASMAQFPDRFRCGVDTVGVVDFINFLKNTKSYRKALREVEYGPSEDEAFLRSISPTTMADRIKGKLLIAHGANDPRVPVSDAYILAEKLTAAGNKPDMLIFDDEGHGFRKKKNRITYHERIAAFLEGCSPDL